MKKVGRKGWSKRLIERLVGKVGRKGWLSRRKTFRGLLLDDTYTSNSSKDSYLLHWHHDPLSNGAAFIIPRQDLANEKKTSSTLSRHYAAALHSKRRTSLGSQEHPQPSLYRCIAYRRKDHIMPARVSSIDTTPMYCMSKKGSRWARKDILDRHYTAAFHIERRISSGLQKYPRSSLYCCIACRKKSLVRLAVKSINDGKDRFLLFHTRREQLVTTETAVQVGPATNFVSICCQAFYRLTSHGLSIPIEHCFRERFTSS